MSRDFLDEDLLRDDPGEGPSGSAAGDGRSNAELEEEVTRLARQRRELDGQVAGAAQEIEELRRRQSALEQQKTKLEELGRRQTAYEEQKRAVIADLDRGILSLEKEQARADRMVALYAEMRARFAEALTEIRDIDEETWPEEGFEEELNRAFERVEDARALHKKALSRLEACDWRAAPAPGRREEAAAPAAKPLGRQLGFLFWLKAGLAFSLPLFAGAAVLLAVYLYLTGLI